jgi:Rrf2 family protein
MVEVARSAPNEGIFQKDIAIAQDISNKYLDHIIHGLKVAGLISNTQGRKSGYVLTREADKITIFDIHNAFEAGICVVDCMNESFNCDREENCEVNGFWAGLNNCVSEYFKSVTLQDLVDKNTILEDKVG